MFYIPVKALSCLVTQRNSRQVMSLKAAEWTKYWSIWRAHRDQVSAPAHTSLGGSLHYSDHGWFPVSEQTFVFLCSYIMSHIGGVSAAEQDGYRQSTVGSAQSPDGLESFPAPWLHARLTMWFIKTFIRMMKKKRARTNMSVSAGRTSDCAWLASVLILDLTDSLLVI